MKNFAKKFIWFVSITALIIVQPLFAQNTGKYAVKIKTIEDFVKIQMEMDRTPGLSIGFLKGDFVWTKGFGYTDLENNTPSTAESAYRLASITKTMTAVAVLQLVEKGKINLDAEVQDYVPYFPRKKWPVTVRQLLGHLGGISHYRDYDAEGHIKVHKDTREALAIFQDFDLVAEPGTEFNYSSYGFNLLGAVIEGASKQSFGNYMRENIWQPLGMSNTFMDNPEEIIPGRVKGYRLIEGKVKPSEFIDISSRFAGGGTRSTVVDMLNFAKGIIDAKLLSKKTIEQMSTSMATKEGRYTDYGMGWSIGTVNGRFLIAHSGGQAETRTRLVIFPQEKFAIAVACNFEQANPYLYAIRLFQILNNEPWNLSLYTGEESKDALLLGMKDVFIYGLSYFEKYQKPLTDDQKELIKAFSFFNKFVNPEAIKSDYDKAMEKIKAGRHPIEKEAFVKIGSFMAMKLQEKYGSECFKTYHKMGSITFFNDYIQMHKKSPDQAKELQFNEGFVLAVKEFKREYEKTYNEYTMNLIITPYSNWEVLEKKLKNNFIGASIYPDFTEELANIIEYYYITGDKDKAFHVGNLAIELYPNSAIPYIMLANAHVCFGDKKKAKELYKKAKEAKLNKQWFNPRNFRYYAEWLWEYGGKTEEAEDLLEVALEIHPKAATLHYLMGLIYINNAKNCLKKAIEYDPNHDSAWKTLKKIE